MLSMTMPKLDKAMRLMVAIERAPMSSVELAAATGISRPTVVRLVASLRELGCKIEAVQSETGKRDFSYQLRDWGVFDRARVRAYVKGLK